ncbi:hypothetical protein AgCh_034346 [Apium graveolens]
MVTLALAASKENKGKNYEVIDEAKAFVGAVRDATNFASADTIYGSAASIRGELLGECGFSELDSQTKYVKDLLKKFGMVDCSPASTPMSTTTKLDEDKKGKSVDIFGYSGMIGSFLYLTASRPDIMFATCLRARF